MGLNYLSFTFLVNNSSFKTEPIFVEDDFQYLMTHSYQIVATHRLYELTSLMLEHDVTSSTIFVHTTNDDSMYSNSK